MTDNRAAFLALLQRVFDEEAFITFCYDHFRVVYQQFTVQLDHATRVKKLFNSCRSYNTFDKLGAALEIERPEEYPRFLPLLQAAKQNQGANADMSEQRPASLTPSGQGALPVICPNCKTELKADLAGLTNFCPHCGQPISSPPARPTGGDGDIIISSINAKNVAMGHRSQFVFTEGSGSNDLSYLFSGIYQRIEQRPPDPDVEKEEITETVQKIEAEVTKGEQANLKKLTRWLKGLSDMAPDIFETTIICLSNPAVGIAPAISNIAQKVKVEASGKT